MSDIDPGDMLLNRQIQDEKRTQIIGQYTREDVGLEPSQTNWRKMPVIDPTNRNLAMQLAIQHNPDADMATLRDAANEFYSYLTQQN